MQGVIVQGNPTRQAFQVLQTTSNSRGHEPKWHISREAISAAIVLKLSNLKTIQQALISTNSPAEQIRVVRNYFAHRRSNCAEHLITASFFENGMSLGPFGVSGFIRDDGRTMFEFWVAELQLVAGGRIQ